MTAEFLWPRWLEREFAEIHESWRPLREAVARDWDRLLGTGKIPPAFRHPEPTSVDPHAEALALNNGAQLARAAAQEVPFGDLDGQVRNLGYGCVGWVPDSWTVVQPQPPADPNFDLYGAAREMHRAMSAAPPFAPWGPKRSAPTHTIGLDCWCQPVQVGPDALHLDDRVPPGHGWIFQ